MSADLQGLRAAQAERIRRGHTDDGPTFTHALDDCERAEDDIEAALDLVERLQEQIENSSGAVRGALDLAETAEATVARLSASEAALRHERDLMVWLWAEREEQDEAFWRAINPPEGANDVR